MKHSQLNLQTFYVPLQTALLILGELSRDLMSLFADGGVCLVSWMRHSLAAQKYYDFLSTKTEQAFGIF